MVSAPRYKGNIKRPSSGGYRTNSYNPEFPSCSGRPNIDEDTGLLFGTNPDGEIVYRRPPMILGWLVNSRFWGYLLCSPMATVLGNSTLHLLLILLPFALIAAPLNWPPVAQFILSFLSIISLSSLIDYTTEELSMKLGQTLGGLTVAAFENSIEIVVSIVALRYKEIQLVKSSLVGYIVANNLFSIGCSFLIGGLQHHEQYLGPIAIWPMFFVMAVATITMAIPTIVHFIVEHFNHQVPDNTVISRGSAVALFLVYLAYLYFQLKSHPNLFDGPEVEQETEEEEDLHVLPIWGALLILIASIVLVALCTQSLMANIDTIAEMTHSSKTFVGFIIIPFLSNTISCFTVVKVAMLDKMDLMIAFSVGYSVQILLFVMPLIILVVWVMEPSLTLSFGITETVILLFSSFVTILNLQKGHSTYMDGVLFLGLYVVIALTMFVYASDSMV